MSVDLDVLMGNMVMQQGTVSGLSFQIREGRPC